MKKLAALLFAVGLLFLGCDDVAELLKSSDCIITGLSIEGLDIDYDIDGDTKTITVTVPAGTSVTAIMPVVTFTGASISPAAGTTLDFSSPVEFTITAEDGTKAVYTVKVVVADPLSDAKAITSFGFTDPAVVGTIDETAGTIAVDVPYGTNVTALVPAITHTGESISPADGAAQDFTSDVTYTVTAEDGSENPYVVTVSVEAEVIDDPDEIPAELAGTWYAVIDDLIFSMVWNENGDLELYGIDSSNSIVNTPPPISYVVNGNTISFSSSSFYEAESVIYNFSQVGGELTFSKVYDPYDELFDIVSVVWSTTQPDFPVVEGYSVSGTVTVPESVTSGFYSVSLEVVDDDSENSLTIIYYAEGTFSGNSFNYVIENVAAGAYFLCGSVDSDYTEGDQHLTANYFGAYGSAENTFPDAENFIVDGDETQDFDVYMNSWDPDYVGTWYRILYGSELYTLEIRADGTFATGVSQDPVSNWDTGTYVDNGDELTLYMDGISDDGGVYGFTYDGSALAFSLVSDSMDDRSGYIVGTWTAAVPATYEVTGTINLPESVSGKKYYVAVDSNDEGSDGMNYIHGEVTGSSFDYSVGGFIAGTYYLYAVVDMDGSWGEDECGPASEGDYWVFYDMSGGNPPESASLVITGDRQLGDLEAEEYTAGTADSTYTVSGTISLPESVSAKSYSICLDTNIDGGDGVVDAIAGSVTGSSISYSFSGVDGGNYYLYAVVDNDDSGDGLSDGDYFSVYGMEGTDPTTGDSIDVSGDMTLDMTLIEWGSSGDSGYTVSGTITLPADATGKKYYVGIDTDHEGQNGMTAMAAGTVSGSTISYEVTGVPDGTYYLYACVDVVEEADYTWNGADSGPVGHGDYYAGYGSPSDPPQLTISGQDITLSDLVAITITEEEETDEVREAYVAVWTGLNTEASTSNSADYSTVTLTLTNYVDAGSGYTINGSYVITNHASGDDIYQTSVIDMTLSGGNVTNLYETCDGSMNRNLTVTYADGLTEDYENYDIGS